MAKADCTRGCWIAGGAVGLLVWIMSAIGDLRWYEAPFLGLITFYLMSRFLIWALCEGNFDQPKDIVAQPAPFAAQPAAPVAAPAMALASPADPVIAQAPAPTAAARAEPGAAPADSAPAEAAGIVEPVKVKKPAKDKSGKKDAKAKADKPKSGKKAKAEKADKGKAAKAEKSEKRARKQAKAEAAVQAAPDDLKQIKGVGPKLEELLNQNGITRFDQIAAWNDAEIDRFADLIGRMGGRIRSDDWKSQARILAEGGETEFSQRVDKGEVY